MVVEKSLKHMRRQITLHQLATKAKKMTRLVSAKDLRDCRNKAKTKTQ